MRITRYLIVAAALFAQPALADWTGKDASGSTITFKNSGTCTSVVCVPQSQPVDSTGAAFGVTGNPFFMTTPAGAAATSALQTTINTSIGTVNTTLGTTNTNTAATNTSVSTTNTNLGAPGATACASDTASCSLNQLIQRLAQNLTTLNTTASTPGTLSSQYPSGSTALTASATGTTGATTATLAAASSKITYLCSFSIRSNATAAATGNATITGPVTGTLNFTHFTAANASGIGTTQQEYSPCVPASATNTAIAVISPAPGTGGVVSVTATGYQL